MKRLKSEENLQLIREMSCCVCGAENMSDAHHIKTRGSGGGDELSNLMPLDRMCHIKAHTIGVKTFYKRYKGSIDAHRKLNYLPELTERDNYEIFRSLPMDE